MNRLDEIRQLFEFHRWANRRLLEAVAALTEEQFARDLGSSFPSVRDTLVHVLGAEWVWLTRWLGSSPSGTPPEWKRLAYPELLRVWEEMEAQQAAFVDGLTEERLDEVLAYRTLAGAPQESALWQMLRHVVNHGTYHRGQLTTMLRQLGGTPPSTDLIQFYRTVATPAGPRTEPA